MKPSKKIPKPFDPPVTMIEMPGGKMPYEEAMMWAQEAKEREAYHKKLRKEHPELYGCPPALNNDDQEKANEETSGSEGTELTKQRVYEMLRDDLRLAEKGEEAAAEIALRYANIWENRPTWAIPAIYLSDLREEMLLNHG